MQEGISPILCVVLSLIRLRMRRHFIHWDVHRGRRADGFANVRFTHTHRGRSAADGCIVRSYQTSQLRGPLHYRPSTNITKQNKQKFKVRQPQRAARSKRPNTPSDGSKNNGIHTTKQEEYPSRHPTTDTANSSTSKQSTSRRLIHYPSKHDHAHGTI